jgi:8-oxo-dGTP diphosphatase
MSKNPQVILNDRYQVVPRTLILVFQGESVLLVKGAKDKKIWPGYYNGLGGHIERGEDVLTSARRELWEEAGLRCLDLHLRGTVTIDVEPENGILMFVLSGSEIEGSLSESAEGSLHWVKIADLDQILAVEDIPEIARRLFTTLDSREVFHAHYAYDSTGKRITTFS